MKFYHIKVACDEKKYGKPYTMATVCIEASKSAPGNYGVYVGCSMCSPRDTFSRRAGRLRAEVNMLDTMGDTFGVGHFDTSADPSGYEAAVHWLQFLPHPSWYLGLYHGPEPKRVDETAQACIDLVHGLGSHIGVGTLRAGIGEELYALFMKAHLAINEAGVYEDQEPPLGSDYLFHPRGRNA